MPVKKKYKKNHREIKLPSHPPRKIPQLVKELVHALNQQKTSIRAFAKTEKISFSKVYNWISGKAEPKRDSTETIMRYFKKIKYSYLQETVDNTRARTVEEGSATYHTGKMSATDKRLYSRSLPMIMKDIQLALRLHAEQVEYIRFNLHRLTDKLKTVSGDVKALQDLLIERYAGDDAGVAEKMHADIQLASQRYAASPGT